MATAETTITPAPRPDLRCRLARGVVRLSVIVAAMGAIALTLGLIFSPDRAAIFPASFAGRLSPPPNGVEVINTEAGLVWFLPAEGDQPAPIIILFHGNGENIAALLPNAKVYQSRGLAVALVEYPGYGGTAGKPTQRTVTNAAIVAYDTIAERADVDQSRIIAHGFSLGGAVAAQLADSRGVHGLILESTFTSMPAMYRSMRIPGFLCRDPFRTDAILAEYAGPVLLMHGKRDTIVPPSHSQDLLAIARNATYLEMEGGHNDGPSDPVAYWQHIDALIEKAIGTPISPAAEQPRSGDGPR